MTSAETKENSAIASAAAAAAIDNCCESRRAEEMSNPQCLSICVCSDGCRGHLNLSCVRHIFTSNK